MPRKSWNSARIRFFKLDYERVMRALKGYAENALLKGARAVILVGSLARGDYTAFSDADIIIIMEKAHKNPVKRLKDFIDPTLPIDVEPRVYTIHELLKMAREGRRIIREMLTYGKLLAGDKTIIKSLKEHLRQINGEREV